MQPQGSWLWKYVSFDFTPPGVHQLEQSCPTSHISKGDEQIHALLKRYPNARRSVQRTVFTGVARFPNCRAQRQRSTWQRSHEASDLEIKTSCHISAELAFGVKSCAYRKTPREICVANFYYHFSNDNIWGRSSKLISLNTTATMVTACKQQLLERPSFTTYHLLAVHSRYISFVL